MIVLFNMLGTKSSIHIKALKINFMGLILHFVSVGKALSYQQKEVGERRGI